MPYYTWRGIDLAGTIHTGKLFAKNEADLDRVLFKQDIALLAAVPVKIYAWLPITMHHKIDMLRHLDELLKAGVLLPEALVILASQPQHAALYTILNTVAHEVNEGGSLPHAVQKHPKVFDSVTLHMVAAGVEAGRLPQALSLLARHLEIVHDFRKKLKNALLMPLCTFIFFFFVSFIILVFIIPHYVSMFSAINQPLPVVTRALIVVSDFVSAYWVILVGFLSTVILFFIVLARTRKGKMIGDRVMLSVPYIGTLIRQSMASQFLRAVSLLISSGMPLVSALKIAGSSLTNSYIAQRAVIIAHEVEGGSSLSRAMMHDPTHIFGDDIITVVRIGEESSNLSALLAQTADAYQDRVKRSLHFISTVAQPLLMVILGLLITALIFAIYIPIFNLSHAV